MSTLSHGQIKSDVRQRPPRLKSPLLEWYKNPPNWFGAEPVLSEGIGEEALGRHVKQWGYGI